MSHLICICNWHIIAFEILNKCGIVFLSIIQIYQYPTTKNMAKKTPQTTPRSGKSMKSAKSAKLKTKRVQSVTHDTGANDLSALLKVAGLKSTQGRIGVLETLFLTETPITVESIIKELGKTSPDRATVYRIVDQFVKVNLAKEVHFNDGVVRYEIVGAVEHDHCCHHVVCKNCGFAEHVESTQIESAIEKLIAHVPNFRSVDGHSLEFFGTCNGCTGPALTKSGVKKTGAKKLLNSKKPGTKKIKK